MKVDKLQEALIAIIIGIIVVAAGATFIVMQPTGKAPTGPPPECDCVITSCNTSVPEIAPSSTNDLVTVSWSFNSGDRTELQRSLNGSTWNTIYQDDNPTQTDHQYSDISVSNGTKYYYRAVNYGHAVECMCGRGADCSLTSGTVNVTPVAPPEKPTVSPGNAQVSVSWNSVQGAINYKIQRNGTDLSNTITGTTFTDTGLTNGLSYYYAVKACSSTGCSEPSVQSDTVVPSAGNQPPSLNTFGPYALNLQKFSNVLIKGTATDSDGTIASIDWTSSDCTILSPMKQGIGTATANIAATAQCTQLGIKTAALTATDNAGATNSAQAQIDVFNLKVNSASTNKTSYQGGETITFNASWISSYVPANVYFCKSATINSTPPYCTDLAWCSIPVLDSSTNSGSCNYNSSNSDTGTKNYYPIIINSKGYIDSAYPSGSFTVIQSNDTQAPTVTITSPQNNSTVSGTVTVNADASDNLGVSKVEFYIDDDNIPKLTDTTAPYSYQWDTTTYSNAPHTIKVKAYDAADNNASASIAVTVSNNLPQPPAVPAGLAGAIGDTNAILSWIAVSGANSYTLGWNTNNSSSYIDINNITANSYVHRNLNNETTYYYAVKACNANGCSAFSSPNVSVKPMACTRKGDVTHDNTINCTDLQWLSEMYAGSPRRQADMCGDMDNSGLISTIDLIKLSHDYNLQYCGDTLPPIISITRPVNYDTVTGTVDINATVTDVGTITKAELYIDDLLKSTDTTAPYGWSWNTVDSSDGTHTIKVKAYDAAGNNDFNSIIVTVNNEGYGPPKIKSFNCTASNQSVTLSWTATGSPTIYYTLSRGLSAGSYTAISNATNITLTQYLDSGLSNGTTYYYKLKATNNYNGSSSSESTCSATPQARVCGNGVIETGEQCEADSDCHQPTHKCDTVNRKYGTRDVYCSSCSCIAEDWSWNSSTSSGSDYCTECATCGDDQCNCNESKSSCPADCGGTTTDTIPPAKPSGLEAQAGNSKVELSWNANSESDLSKYIVYYGTSSGSYGTDIIETTGNSATVYELQNGTTYYFSVRAVDSSGNKSTYSDEVSSTPQASISNVNPPSNVKASFSEGKVKLQWNEASPAPDSYEIYKKLSTEGSYKKISSTGNTSYYDSDVTPGKTYNYKIKSVKDGIKSDYSAKASITIPGALECNPAKDDYCDTACARGKDPDCSPCVKNGECEKDFNESFSNCPEDCKEGVDIASPEMGIGAGIVAVAVVIAIAFFKLIPGT
ncbi:MAG: Ig-like domain-containing protein [Candidatus Diapherotrites archaeon]